MVPVASEDVARAPPVSPSLRVVGPECLGRAFLEGSPNDEGEEGVAPTVFLDWAEDAVPARDDYRVVFIVVGVVGASRVESRNVLAGAVDVLLIALSDVWRYRVVAVAWREGVGAKDPWPLPLVVLMDDAWCYVSVVFSGVLIGVRHILGRRVVDVVAYFLTLQVAVFLVLLPVAFAAGP